MMNNHARQILHTIGALILLTVLTTPYAWAQAETGAGYDVPRFRNIDTSLSEEGLKPVGEIRFLTEDDFPPFSYLDATGALTGFNVTLMAELCKTLRLDCRYIIKPFDQSIEALNAGQADAIVSGINRNTRTYDTLDFTRPYYRALARFLVREENQTKQPEVRVLAGKRIGVRAGSTHETFLRDNYHRSVIRPFKSDDDAREALRTGVIDALFGDAMKEMFWLASKRSRGCCRFLAGAFSQPPYFDRALTVAVKRGNDALRRTLDYGLDRLQSNGAYDRIFRRYFPDSPSG